MRIDLGCGERRRPGFIAVDRYPESGAMVAADAIRLPFRDSSASEIHLDNVIEHIPDLIALMRELVRVGQPGARIFVITPHFSAWASWRDPTHVHHFSYFSMEHFESKWIARYAGARLRTVSRRLSFGGGILGLIGRAIFTVSPRAYEKKWCFLFRASTLRFELEVEKGGGDGGGAGAGVEGRP